MRSFGYILLFLLPLFTKAQESIHLKGQSYLELCWQRNLEYSPGLSFALSAGMYLGPKAGFQLGISKNLFYAFEKEPFWQNDELQDSILFNRLVRRSYSSHSVFAIYQHLIAKNKERLFLKGLIGAEFGRERFADQNAAAFYGPMLGSELVVYLLAPIAITARYSFHYHPNSRFQSKSHVQLGIRLLLQNN